MIAKIASMAVSKAVNATEAESMGLRVAGALAEKEFTKETTKNTVAKIAQKAIYDADNLTRKEGIILRMADAAAIAKENG